MTILAVAHGRQTATDPGVQGAVDAEAEECAARLGNTPSEARALRHHGDRSAAPMRAQPIAIVTDFDHGGPLPQPLVVVVVGRKITPINAFWP